MIFVPFFGHLWGHIKSDLENLNSTEKTQEKESKKKGKKRKLLEEGQAEEVVVVQKSGSVSSDELETVQLLLSSLTKCFEYDEIGFLNATR